MNIKFTHLAKDNKTDSLTCSCCNSKLRHAMIIDNEIFGLDCGAKKLGFSCKTTAQVNRKVTRMVGAASHFLALMDSDTTDTSKAIAAGIVCSEFNLTISRFDPEFLSKVREAIS